MNTTDWKAHWDKRSEQATSDVSFDRGGNAQEAETGNISDPELLNYLEPKSSDAVFDAGCGTGSNIILLHSKVKHILGMDYCKGAVDRCRRRIQSANIANAQVEQGTITKVPLPDSSIDKALCMSVLQYVDDVEAKTAVGELARILRKEGILVLHLKNSSSIYLSTLLLAKKVKSAFGKSTKIGYYRSFKWYSTVLSSYGFDIVNYDSFNLFVLPKMPAFVTHLLQRLEMKLRNIAKPLFRVSFIRRHGSDLKIKAILRRRVTATGPDRADHGDES